jgi:hypothetical protein
VQLEKQFDLNSLSLLARNCLFGCGMYEILEYNSIIDAILDVMVLKIFYFKDN